MTVAGFFDGNLPLALWHVDGEALWALAAVGVVFASLLLVKWFLHEARLYHRTRRGGYVTLPYDREALDRLWNDLANLTDDPEGMRRFARHLREVPPNPDDPRYQDVRQFPGYREVPPPPEGLGIPEPRTGKTFADVRLEHRGTIQRFERLMRDLKAARDDEGAA